MKRRIAVFSREKSKATNISENGFSASAFRLHAHA